MLEDSLNWWVSHLRVHMRGIFEIMRYADLSNPESFHACNLASPNIPWSSSMEKVLLPCSTTKNLDDLAPPHHPTHPICRLVFWLIPTGLFWKDGHSRSWSQIYSMMKFKWSCLNLRGTLLFYVVGGKLASQWQQPTPSWWQQWWGGQYHFYLYMSSSAALSVGQPYHICGPPCQAWLRAFLIMMV